MVIVMSAESKAEWAPCVHSNEDAEKVKPWLKKVLESDPFVDKDADPSEDSVLERILWILSTESFCVRDIRFRFGADQWVCVEAEVTREDGTTDCLRTEGDSFLLALAKTLERLKALPKAQKEEKGDGPEGANTDHGR
jgi:hypothetical protein